MADFETINKGGHTYKRRKGSHDRWVDENGNVVDLTNGNRTVTASSSKRLGTGNNAANPDVWIANGKAYKDDSHGGYKSNYFNAVKKLGQNLGWDNEVGEKSKAALRAQNKAFNASKTKLVSGKTGYITKDGEAKGLQQSKVIRKAGATQDQSRLGKTASTFKSGLDLTERGLEDVWGAFTDNNSSFSRNFTRLGGGLGRMVQGLGQASLGTLSSAILPEEAQQWLGKYGQIVDVGKLSNTIAEGLQGRVMTPWDERNNGLLSHNFDWIGSEQDRQDLQDFGNGVMMLVGTKGAGAGFKGAPRGTRSVMKSGIKATRKTSKPYEAIATLDDEAPLVATTPPSGVKGLPAPKDPILKVTPEPLKGLPAPKSMSNPNLKGLPYEVDAVLDDAGSASKALPAPRTSPAQPAMQEAAKASSRMKPGAGEVFAEAMPDGFKIDYSTLSKVAGGGKHATAAYFKNIANTFRDAGIKVNLNGLQNYASDVASAMTKKYGPGESAFGGIKPFQITNPEELVAIRQKYNFKHGGSLYKKYFI